MTDFDVIVIGGGLAGLGTAYRIAGNLDVLVIERGKTPGSKNVTGGRIYLKSLRKYAPEIAENMPYQRKIVKERFSFLTENEGVTVEYMGESNSATVIRAELDSWLAERVEEKGGIVASGVRVDDVQVEEEAVRIVAGNDEITSEVAVISDGVQSPAGKRAGLREDFKPEELAVGVKEVIRLDEDEINTRFGLGSGEGLANLFAGYPSDYLQGGGFLYTNKESVSIGVVVNLKALALSDVELEQLIERFKNHPLISSVIEGGRSEEYSAHLIPEGGFDAIPGLYRDRILLTGDSAGLCLNTGITVRGMDFALISGIIAGDVILKCMERKDFSANSLSLYENLLSGSVLNEMKKFRKARYFLENRRLYENYPRCSTEIMRKIFDVDREHLITEIRSVLGEYGGTLSAILDLLKGGRVL